MRRQKMAVGQLRKSLALAGDADEIFHVVVPGSNFLVPDRPIHAHALALIGFKIKIAPAVRLPSPDDRPAAHLASANPQERFARLGRVRILLVVDEELAVPLVHSAAGFLHGLVFLHPPAVAHPAIAHFPLGHMFGVVLVGIDGAPGLENQRLQSLFAQFLRGPSPGDSRAHHDCVVCLGCHAYFAASSSRGTQAAWRDGMISP